MNLEYLPPVLSGLAGAAVASWLAVKWARWLPKVADDRSRERLLHDHRVAIRVANVVMAMAMFGTLALYKFGGFPSNAWRPLGLGLGLTLCAPSLTLPLTAWLTRRPIRDSLVSFAISQRMPMVVFWLVTLLGWGMFLPTLATFL